MERKQVGFRFLSEPDMIKAGVLDVKNAWRLWTTLLSFWEPGIL